MRQQVCWMIGLILLLSAGMGMAADEKQAAKDWKEMDMLLTERETFLYQNIFEKNPDEFVENWIRFSEHFSKKSDDFISRYGSDRNELNKRFESVPAPEGVKRDNYMFVNEFLGADIDGLHRNIVDWAEAMGQDQYLRWEQLKDPDPKKVELKHQYARRAVTGYRAAHRLNPEGNYRDLLKKSEAAAKETKELFEKTLKSFTWPGHNSKFEGPGKPDVLAAAALDFLRENPKWSKPEYNDDHIPYAACVTSSSWEVWKRAPLTQVPTQYSLDMMVAFAGTQDSDIVYVYNMVFYTAEEGGVEMGLPFRYANSKQYQKHQMLKDSIPKKSVYKASAGIQTRADDSAEKKDYSLPRAVSPDVEKSGSSFGIWRFVFSLLLIFGGMIGAHSLLIEKVPNLKSFVEKLKTAAMPIGLLLVFIGLFGFLCNLFRLAPHASFLPQVAGVALGILLLKKNSGPIPDKFLEKINLPDTMELPVGLAAIAFGLLHLVIGGLPLL